MDRVNIKCFCFNPFRENCYLLWGGSDDCVIVDPGCYEPSEVSALTGFISSKGLVPRAIWLTHGHFDHIFGVAELSRKYSIPVYLSPLDGVTIGSNNDLTQGFGLRRPDMSFETRELVEGQILRFAQDDNSPSFEVIPTPGHTPGCVCFYCEQAKILLSGDTLFAGSIGRTDVEGGDYDKEILSIMDKLMLLPGDVDVYPGHGPATSIAVERTTNPFLQPFNEPFEGDTTEDNNEICI